MRAHAHTFQSFTFHGGRSKDEMRVAEKIVLDRFWTSFYTSFLYREKVDEESLQTALCCHEYFFHGCFFHRACEAAFLFCVLHVPAALYRCEITRLVFSSA